jgi:UDP-N-acetylglucosamine 4-epimerase
LADVECRLQAEPARWLVTGAAGFIGSHLVQRLLELGQTVVALDNYSTGHPHNLEDVRRGLEGSGHEGAWARLTIVEGDVRDAATCVRLCAQVDHVLHQAAIGSVPRSVADPRGTHESNVDGFFNALEGARAGGCRSFVYASSSSVYGDHPALPKVEADVGRPLSPYAATKRLGELYAAAYARCYGLAAIGLRYFNVVGSRQDPEGAYAAVVPRWIAALRRGQAPVIYGDGLTTRDFCPVANAVNANLLAARAGSEAGGSVFNVALGGTTSLLELFALLRDALADLGAPCRDIEPVFEDFRPGDIRHSRASIQAARDGLGYEPAIDLRGGLQETVEWFWTRRG